ncbi:DUF7446 family protein [Corynebacterium glyciniphilum]|uniref:DUF7446 family protein n=1 Tax=Corynebacterium glyciniphilum TaxID=1404244 RepID=UPI003FD2B566
MTAEETIGVSFQPFSRTIAAGRLSKDRRTFLAGKTEVTHQAAVAVAQWVLEKFPGGMTLTDDHGNGYQITARKMKNGEVETP